MAKVLALPELADLVTKLLMVPNNQVISKELANFAESIADAVGYYLNVEHTGISQAPDVNDQYSFAFYRRESSPSHDMFTLYDPEGAWSDEEDAG